ncbi:MAG: HD domain-containing protein [Nanoarchaeota archaeon]
MQGRDWKHALRVVEWVWKLGNGRSDLSLLIAAAYIHDIGWRNVLPSQKISFDELLRFERQANENSEPYAHEFLEKNDFRETEIVMILRLVAAADAHQSQKEDEAVIVDADNLSKLCIEHLQEKYRKEEWKKMAHMWEQEFPSRMRTKQGREIFLDLLQKLMAAVEAAS